MEMSDFATETKIKIFSDIVRKYCSWVETSSNNLEQEMVIARKLLAELHLAILDLLDIDLPDLNRDQEVEAIRYCYKRSGIYQRFHTLPINNYWDVFEPLNIDDNEPVLNSFIDDLTDIYLELKRGLILYDKNDFLEAVWEWRFHFEIHWGAHLVGAQRVIHNYFS